MRILVVEDNKDLQKCYRFMLNRAELIFTESAEEAFSILNKSDEAGEKFDLALIDSKLAGKMTGLELGAKIRAKFGVDSPLMIFISGIIDENIRRQTDEIGFLRCLEKPFGVERVSTIMEKLRDLVVKLKDSELDSVTKFPNRAYFERRLESAYADCSDGGKTFGVIFADLDDFKSVNDKMGHFIGDEVLRVTGQRIMSALDEFKPIVARFAGDEFAAIVKAKDREEVKAAAEKVRRNFDNVMTVSNHVTVAQKISVGYAFCHEAESAKELLSNADLQMYSEKFFQKQKLKAS